MKESEALILTYNILLTLCYGSVINLVMLFIVLKEIRRLAVDVFYLRAAVNDVLLETTESSASSEPDDPDETTV